MTISRNHQFPRPKLTASRCRCSACGELFNFVRAFDSHRTGGYSPLQRRCRSREEMLAIGMSCNPDRFWITESRAERAVRRGSRPTAGDRAWPPLKGDPELSGSETPGRGVLDDYQSGRPPDAALKTAARDLVRRLVSAECPKWLICILPGLSTHVVRRILAG